MQSNYNNLDQNNNSVDTNNGESVSTNTNSSGIKFLQNKKFQSKKAKLIAGGLFVLFLVVALTAGYLLTQTGQDLRQQAAVADYPGTCYTGSCPSGWETANTGMCYPECGGSQVCCIPITVCSTYEAGTPQCPVHSNLATACPDWANKGTCTGWLSGACHPVYGLVCGDGSWGVPCTPNPSDPNDPCQHCSVCGNYERCPEVTPTPPTYNSPTPTPPTYNSPTPTPTDTLSPTPTIPPVYPQCLSIVMTEPDQTPILNPEMADIGQLVRFSCMADDPTLVAWYEFRTAKRVPVNQSIITALASDPVGSNVSALYEIMAGEYVAQCRICSIDAQPGVCDTDWEPIIWPESGTPIPTHTPLPPPGSPEPIVCNPDGSVAMMSNLGNNEIEVAVQSQIPYANVELRIVTTTDQTLVYRDPDLSGSYIWTWLINNIQPAQIENIYFFVDANPSNPGYGGTCKGML